MRTATLRLWRLDVTVGFIVINLVSILLSKQPLLPIFLAAAVLHELGHVAAICLSGGRVRKLKLSAVGAELDTDMTRLSYYSEVLVYLSGPLCGLAVASLAALFARLYDSETLYVFAGVNAALGVFNLLPARPLDGGGIVQSLSMLLCGRITAFVDALHYFSVAVLAALAVIAFVHGGFNIALFWTAGWLLFSGLRL